MNPLKLIRVVLRFKFKEETSLRILKSDNPESIHNHFKGSAKPFIFQTDVKGTNPFEIKTVRKNC